MYALERLYLGRDRRKNLQHTSQLNPAEKRVSTQWFAEYFCLHFGAENAVFIIVKLNDVGKRKNIMPELSKLPDPMGTAIPYRQPPALLLQDHCHAPSLS
jgi:hypothetical protein